MTKLQYIFLSFFQIAIKLNMIQPLFFIDSNTTKTFVLPV